METETEMERERERERGGDKEGRRKGGSDGII